MTGEMEDLRPSGIAPEAEAAAAAADGSELKGAKDSGFGGQIVVRLGRSHRLYPLSVGTRDRDKTSGTRGNLQWRQKGGWGEKRVMKKMQSFEGKGEIIIALRPHERKGHVGEARASKKNEARATLQTSLLS